MTDPQIQSRVYDPESIAFAVSRHESEHFQTRIEKEVVTVGIDDITEGEVALVAIDRTGDVELESYIRMPASGAERIGKALQHAAEVAREQVSEE